MRKLLILLMMVLLLILCGYTIYDGIKIGDLKILGITQIKEKTDELDSQIDKASRLSSADYPKVLAELTNAYKDLETEKENYDNLVAISSSEEVQEASIYEKYEIEFLWTKIGNHATAEGVTLKLEVKASSSGTSGLYDLYFTVNGSYVGITDFISDIENDSKLGFKIDDFKLIPTSGDASELQATFICKDVSINLDNKVDASAGTAGTSTTSSMQNNSTNTVNSNTKTENTTIQ